MKPSFHKLSQNYESEPNVAVPEIEQIENNVSLTFPLNCMTSPNFSDNERGKVVFNDVLMYRVGDPNDEGFYSDPRNSDGIKNHTQWNQADFPVLEFHNFYQIENSDWQTTFCSVGVVNVKSMTEVANMNRYHHYLFFMKEGTFECVAHGYKEYIPIK